MDPITRSGWSCPQHNFHIPESCIVNQNPRKQRKRSVDEDELRENAEESGKSPDGETAKPGPGAAMASGFGGLGLEGMVGSEDSAGESGTPAGEGNRGEMSGEREGEGEERGELGRYAGEAEMDDS